MKLVFDHMLTPAGSQVMQIEPHAHKQVVERTIKANLAYATKPFIQIESTGPDKFQGVLHVHSDKTFCAAIEALKDVAQSTSPAELQIKVSYLYQLLIS